jgi:malonyl-CoA/methylmalonyl-CoA synthetase
VNLTQLFDLSFQRRREEVALEFSGHTYTFGEIDARSNRMAALFRARGLERGDRLCVYLSNCVALIDIYLACVKMGIIFVPINILYRDREILHILGDAEPKAVVAAQQMPGATPLWLVSELDPPRRWSTPPALPGSPKAPSLRTITLQSMRST